MIGLISDIHGNYVALLAVLNALDYLGVEEVYCLGDVVGYYSMVNECCDELKRRNVHCIMGNHDWYLVAGSFCPRSNSVNDCIAYQRTVLKPEHLQWLSTFPTFRTVQSIFMVHGGWTDPIDEYLNPKAEYFARVSGQRFASGHTHIQQTLRFGSLDKQYCNPGSVGQPRDNNPHAAFATFDGEDFQLHRVPYDIDEIGRAMEKAGFSGYYYGCLKTGARRLQWAEDGS